VAHAPGRLVIRTYAPLRRWLLLGGTAILGLLLVYVAFELGRRRSDTESVAVARSHAELTERVSELEATNRELRVKLAAQDSTQVGQARERAEVARTIGELQAQIARQTQDLAFYRGIAGDSSAAPPVRIQQFRVAALGAPGRYSLRLVLGRPLRPEDVVNGTLQLTVEGTQGDKPATLDFGQLTGGQVRELRFNYRYLQTFEQEFALPADFRPTRSTIEVRVARKGVEPARQSFLWNLEHG
jgi:hypothetical protein